MSEHELEILLMGYVDNELDDAQRARVDAALADDENLRRELAGMQRLKRLTSAANVDADADMEIDRFWGAVYNRMERHVAWALLVAGSLITSAGLLLLFFRNGAFPMALRVSVGCALAGFALLFWSVLRQRFKLIRHDRYSKEVHR